jgi:23S rRNA (adenine2030-N6)-methyltransferase
VLAYRHLFHAGNVADVFKHAVLAQMVELIKRKEKPFFYLDTHGGIGRYDLSHAWATKNREFDDGIGRLIARADHPLALRPYLDAVLAQNPAGELRFYPGSPVLVHRSLRAGDRMAVSELNRDDCVRLQRLFAGERRVQVRNMDGYQALKAFLPPHERRGLILIDSSFDRAGEYRRAGQALIEAYGRFATGVYALWYPLMSPRAVTEFESSIASSGLRKVMKLELSVHPQDWRDGLRGSAMLVINPPYGLEAIAATMLPWLWRALAAKGQGGYRVEWLVPE